MSDKYLIDANIFITAHRSLYPFDIALGFWNQLIEKASSKIVLIEKVDEEIRRGEDELTDWYLEHRNYFEIATIPEQKVIESYSEIISNINENTQYLQSAKDEFASVADSWLCAYGHAYDYTIVTYEKYKPNAKNRVFIPNVCREFNINCIGMLEFMRENEFRL